MPTTADTPSVPTTMAAVQIDGPAAQPSVRTVAVPRPGPGQVLVRMAAAPINPSDLAYLAGRTAPVAGYPATPGIEGSGTVVETGTGWIARRLAGRRVACTRSPETGGTWAEYMITKATRCIPLRRGIALEQASMLVVNPMTALAFFEIRRRGRHRAMVNTAAASQLGRMVQRMASRKGVPLINIVRRGEQADLLRSLGARHVLVSTEADFDLRLAALSRELGATLVLDAVAGELTQHLVDAAPPGAVVLLYAYLSREPARIEPSSLWTHGKRLEGFYLGTWTAHRGLLAALRSSREVQRLAGTELSSTVHARLPLAAVQDALTLYQAGMTAGKVLLTMGSGERGG